MVAGTKRRRKPKQLSFGERRRRDGKVRGKPGRKPGLRPAAPHVERPEHKRWNPLHITLRAIAGLPSFRQELLYAAFERAVRGTRREDFGIVEYSVQPDHLHLVVEAENKDALARGMKSFSVRANRLFNAASGRKRGRVWRERYHRRDLTTPRQVRNALVYVLNNARKHRTISLDGLVIDGFSSAAWFGGWSLARTTSTGPPRPTDLPRTMLLRSLWKKHGLIHPRETPQAKLRSPNASPQRSRWA